MGRKLRVDFSNEGGGDDDSGNTHVSRRLALHCTLMADADKQGSSGGNYASNGTGSSLSNPPSSLPPLPPGKELPPGVTCTDAISRTLNTLPPSQLLDILAQMKTLATNEPQRAIELLQQAPQLTYAIFQALLLMGLVQPDAVQSVIEPSAPPPTLPQVPPAGYGAPAPGYPPPVNNTPPVAGGPYTQPPVQPVAQPYAAPPPAAAGQDADQLLQQVLMLPQEMIDQLPEVERAQIMALRASAGAQRR